MAAIAGDLAPPSKALMLMELRALNEFGAYFQTLPLLSLAPRGDGHPVLVLPGLLAGDSETRQLRQFLSGRRYAVKGWGLGRNTGLRAGLQEDMVRLLKQMSESSGQKVSLIGWSLGGIFARQLAKVLPEHVRQVITLGSPFAGTPRSTNACRIYEWTSGRSADEPMDPAFGGEIAECPPVPTTAIYSRSDGVCAWQGCREQSGTQAESIEVNSSHIGMCHNPSVIYAVADRLAQKDKSWKPFNRNGWRKLVYPNPDR